MLRLSTRLLLLSALSLVATIAQGDEASPAAAERDYSVESTPDWVMKGVPAPGAPAKEAPDGVEYLAVDRQIRLHERGADIYSHFAQRILSEAGVKEESTIVIDFDPLSERIALHSLQVRRGSSVIEQLNIARMSILRRESRLEEGLLDGNLTLSIVLEDVRPGDVIGYSYTRHFYDPVIGNRYYDSYTTQWGAPVRWSRLRLLHPATRSVRTIQTGASIEPVVKSANGWRDTTWEKRDLPGIPDEDDRPSWHLLYPRIWMSEWSSWGDVVDWALPLYRTGALSVEMKELVDGWVAASTTEADRIQAALHFVQDNVRYTGIEIGAGAHRPTDSARVLQRRYGDCKDKVMLLVTLLNAMKIDARPVLVNTWARQGVSKGLPGPGAFDHAIVRVRSGSHTYWFDATRTLQGGSLRTIAQSRLGAALVIEPGVKDFERIPDAVLRAPTTEVTETFDLKSGVAAKGSLTVMTVYRDVEADRMRRELQSSTSEEITRSYLDFYRDWYPGIRALAPLKARDNRRENRLEVTERYEIEPAFAKEDDGGFRFDLTPHVVTSQVKAPRQVRRTTPLEVNHPRNVRYKATVLLPTHWNVTTGEVKIEDPAFVYRSNLKYSKERFDALYEFRTLTDHVEAERSDEYARKLKQVRDDASYWFTHGGDSTAASDTTLNIALVIAVMFGFGGGILFVVRLRAHAPEPREAPANAPTGLRGWLILPVLHTCILPIALAIVLYAFLPFFGMGMWNGIGEGESELAIQLLKLGYFVLVLLGCALLVVSSYLIYLLFARQRTFPLTYIIVTWGMAAWGILNVVVGLNLPGGDAGETARSIGTIIGDLFSAALWTAYMLNSVRVAATFTRERGAPAAVAPQPA